MAVTKGPSPLYHILKSGHGSKRKVTAAQLFLIKPPHRIYHRIHYESSKMLEVIY